MTTIHDLPTPSLLLDLDVLEANLGRMAARARELGVALRPHVKTHKCIEVGERQRALAPAALALARRLAESPRLEFDGILTHSGHSYHGRSRAEISDRQPRAHRS